MKSELNMKQQTNRWFTQKNPATVNSFVFLWRNVFLTWFIGPTSFDCPANDEANGKLNDKT